MAVLTKSAPKMKFLLLGGNHAEGEGKNIRHYVRGEVVVSNRDLTKVFGANKFQRTDRPAGVTKQQLAEAEQEAASAVFEKESEQDATGDDEEEVAKPKIKITDYSKNVTHEYDDAIALSYEICAHPFKRQCLAFHEDNMKVVLYGPCKKTDMKSWLALRAAEETGEPGSEGDAEDTEE